MNIRRLTKTPALHIFLYLLLVGCGDGASTQNAVAQPKDMIRLKRFDVIDSQGFSKPMAVATFLAPSDWKLEGGVRWNTNTQCSMEIAKMQARVVSPDGKTSFEIFPMYTTMWMQDDMINRLTAEKGWTVAPPITNENFIKNIFVPGFRRGARIVSIEPMRDVTQAMLKQQRIAQRDVLRQMQATLDLDVSVARIEYGGAAGQTEEWVLSTLSSMDFMSLNGYGQQMRSNMTSVPIVFSFKTPGGELDKNKKLLDTILNSFRPNPHYQNALQRVRTNMDRIAMQGIQKRINIQQQMNQELSAIRDKGMDNWKRRMASEDQSQRQYIHSIHNTESYSDPHNSGASWDLNAGYDNVWKTANDEFILTNDLNFDPNVSGGATQGWLKMKKTN